MRYLLLSVLLLTSCGAYIPDTTKEPVEPLVTPQCFKARKVVTKSGKVMAMIPWGRILHATPYYGQDEYFEIDLVEEVKKCGSAIPLYCSDYKWDGSGYIAERRLECMKDDENYIVLRLEAVIKIVTFMVKNIPMSLYNYFFPYSNKDVT